MSHSLDAIFRPQSVAVVGASRRKGSMGSAIVENLFRGEFTGAIYPVNPSARVIHSIKAYPTVSSIPDVVDLAVLVVPKELVQAAAEDCAKKGVKGIVVITAGFRETGPEGREREDKLREFCRAHGMRIVGPNCMGVLNAEPEFRLDATFAPSGADFGGVAFASQSGAMGVAILNACRRLGLGLTQFVSMGNKADVSGNDLLEYWEDDPRTKVIAFYLESIGNPERFQTICRRVAKKKPVLIVKSGRSAAGARAASSHTGALAAGETGVAALFEQTGVVRVETLEELFDAATALTRAPLPKGRRLAIVSNAGGPAIMATDAAESNGLELATLSPATEAALRAFLPPEASTRNPVDMIASATPENYEKTLRAVLADDGADAVVLISVPPVAFDSMELMRRVTAAAKDSTKPVYVVAMAPEDFYEEVHAIDGHPPIFRFPENALRALRDAARYSEWRARPLPEPASFTDVDDAKVAALLGARQGWLDPETAFAVLAAYRIPCAAYRAVARPEEVVAAAKAVGYPCVLKASGEKLTHKSDVGAVVLNLKSESEVAAALDAMRSRLAGAGVLEAVDRYTVQKQAASGREVLVGGARDPKLGPLVAFGLGGKYVEALHDVVFRAAPLARVDAEAMVAGLRGAKLLTGVRGDPPVDKAALVDLLCRVGRLMARHPRIAELDLNPVIAQPVGTPTLAVDARIRVS
jgi:acetyl coenzyme A synthetase (ADP forming)-like protein